MNNKVQQKFDRSIRDAVAQTAEANAKKPGRDVRTAPPPARPQPKGRLYLEKETGATIWEPAECMNGGSNG